MGLSWYGAWWHWNSKRESPSFVRKEPTAKLLRFHLIWRVSHLRCPLLREERFRTCEFRGQAFPAFGKYVARLSQLEGSTRVSYSLHEWLLPIVRVLYILGELLGPNPSIL